MASWHHDLQNILMQSTKEVSTEKIQPVLMQSTKEVSTEKIQPEVINHLADISEHFQREYYMVFDISLQLTYISLTKFFGNFTEWTFAEYSNLCLQDFEYTL